MQLSLVFPMFWGRKKKKIYKKNDQFYDHPTAIDDEGTIPPLFTCAMAGAGRSRSPTGPAAGA